MKRTFTSLLRATAVTALCSMAAHSQAQTYQLVWADEFDGSIGPNWKFETGGGGFGNNEKEYYQRSNATVASGNLLITAKKENVGGMPYTSARMTTQGLKEFTYGKIEARIKLPLGQGLWPAFWALGGNINSVGWPKCGEIDIMEQVNADSHTYGTIHWDNNGHAQFGNGIVTSPNDYHVYGIEWDASAIRWYLDGVKYNEASILNSVNGTEEFHRPFFLLLNMAVAGNWPGQTVDESKLPATMSVDYVRVYQLGTTLPPSPPPSETGLLTPVGATASSSESGAMGAGAAIDRNMGTRWASTWADPQHLQLDLGVAKDISRVKISWEAAYGKDYKLETSLDGTSWATIQTVINGDGGVDDITGLAGRGRYLRLTGTRRATAYGYSIFELEAYGPTVSAGPTTIQAESYSAMNGVQVETTADAGGGQNVGYIDANDWLSYSNVTFPATGAYTIEYRVASPGGSSLSSELNAGAAQLGAVAIPATGGWQTWKTVSQTVNVNAGTYNFRVLASAGGWNLNWLRITKAGARAAAPAAASSASVQGIQVYPNPAVNQLNIASQLELADARYQIVDGQGRIVAKGATQGGHVDVSNLKSGVFMLVVTTKDNQKLTRRFSKQ